MNKTSRAGQRPGSTSRGPTGEESSGQGVGSSPSIAPDISESAQSAAASATSAAASLAADAKDAAWGAGQAVQEQAAQLAENVGHELKKTAEHQKTRGAEAIGVFARAIRSAAGELESQSPRVAESARGAAQKMDGLSRNISNRNVDELISAASETARSQPMLFIGGAVAAGYALARFFKSSASHDGSSSESMPETGRRPPAQR